MKLLALNASLKTITMKTLYQRTWPPGYKTLVQSQNQIKRNDQLLGDRCLQAANHCAYFEFENELKFYNLEAWLRGYKTFFILNSAEHKIYPVHKC